MPRFRTAAVARHEYILSRFQSFPVPNSGRVDWRFVGNLPRAVTVQDAVDAAMREDGLAVPAQGGAVEISEQLAKQIKHLISKFVKAAPETVVAPDDAQRTEVFYSYGFSAKFRADPGSTIQQVLDQCCKYEPPSPIAGIRGKSEELYELIHVALRKCADSKITSAAWNAMHVIDGDTRQWLVDVAATTLNAQTYSNLEEVISAVKKAYLDNDEWQGKPGRALLHCLFELFDDNDWCGFLGYCIIWPYEVKTATAPAPVAAVPQEGEAAS